MSQHKTRFLTLSALAICMAQPALSLTAEELWAEWQAQAVAMGQTITAKQVTAENGVLTLRGYASQFSDDDVSTLGQFDQVVMTETGDGRVVVTLSDTSAIRMSFATEPGAAPIEAVVNVIMPGMTITASGDAGARIFAYDAPRITIEVGPITGGMGLLPKIDLTIAIEDYAATVQTDGRDLADMRSITTSSTSAISGAFSLTPPPGEDGTLAASFAIESIAATGTGSFGNLAAIAKTPDVLPPGFGFQSDLRHDSASFELRFAHPSEGFEFLTASQGGSLQTSLSEAGLSFGSATTGSSSSFRGPDVPLAQSDSAQPFGARLAYQDVVLNPEIWDLFDPAQAIPRDPISVIADVTGSLRVLVDLLSTAPDQITGMPGELVDLSLNELRIAVAGAELTGTGAAVFAPGPSPRPVGSVDLQLAGSNALLDRLKNSGLLPVEQLAMARGLLAAFTRPGAGPDTVQTTIAFTEGGGITANGVPLQ
jgi:hypothetical protein